MIIQGDGVVLQDTPKCIPRKVPSLDEVAWQVMAACDFLVLFLGRREAQTPSWFFVGRIPVQSPCGMFASLHMWAGVVLP